MADETWPPIYERPYSTATFGRMSVLYDGDSMVVQKPMLAIKVVSGALWLGICAMLGTHVWDYFDPRSPRHASAAIDLGIFAPLDGVALLLFLVGLRGALAGERIRFQRGSGEVVNGFGKRRTQLAGSVVAVFWDIPIYVVSIREPGLLGRLRSRYRGGYCWITRDKASALGLAAAISDFTGIPVETKLK